MEACCVADNLGKPVYESSAPFMPPCADAGRSPRLALRRIDHTQTAPLPTSVHAEDYHILASEKINSTKCVEVKNITPNANHHARESESARQRPRARLRLRQGQYAENLCGR